ncbi:MAG TPA: S66 peptidase family protein [Streptosporangiaceae bacterium]|nr:S66 peptidase family protein [Streptosporangiaceae bacterium]
MVELPDAVVTARPRLVGGGGHCTTSPTDPLAAATGAQAMEPENRVCAGQAVCFHSRMAYDLVHPPKAHPGERIAVVSPSFAAAGAFPDVHEQAMRRLAEVTGLVPVEYPTTREVGATAQARAADINAAFADPAVRAVLAVIGGEDQITVIPHLDAGLARNDPKPFVGMSDNTNLHQWLWANGIASFYGGSSQVHLGPGPGVDDVHARSLRAALITGGILEVTDPGESEDVGLDWADPRALDSYGEREPTEPWAWYGPARSVTGRTWGGCIEIIEWVLTAGRFPFEPDVLDGGVLLIETSEELLPARNIGWIVRALGERGILAAVDAVLVARPPVSDFTRRPSSEERTRLRAEQRDVVAGVISRYNPRAVVCVGIPFGHTRPQWVLPHGGTVTVDGGARRVVADYS